MNKPWYQSLTVWGGALLAVSKSLEASGVVPEGGSAALVTVAQALGTFLTIFGVRRALR